MSTLAEQPFLLLNDLPVEDDAADLLGTSVVAGELAGLIHGSRSNTPFVLAIDGRWGAGKSTLMRQLSSNLTARGDVEVVWFNAWTASGVSALIGMLKLVLGKLDRNIVRRSFRALNNGGLLSGTMRLGLTAAAGFFRADRAIDELWDRMSVDAKAREEARQLIQTALQSWVEEGGGVPRRTVAVFIDDLDRCSETTAVEICEAIKLYLDLPGIAFIIGCDLNVLSRIPLPGVESAAQVREYLEKIVQVTYQLPMPTEADVEQMMQGYAQQSRTEHLFTEPMQALVGRQSAGNPRRIKRMINSFVAEYQLDPDWRLYGADGLMKAVVLQHFYPDFYQEILRAPGDRAGGLLDYRTLRDWLLRGSGKPEQEPTAVTLETFNIDPPSAREDFDRALSQLDERVPGQWRQLVANDDCLALLRDFGEPIERIRLQQRLRRRPLSTMPDSANAAGRELARLDNVRLLWIDDNPDGNESLINNLAARGAQVRTSTDLNQAVRMISAFRPNIVLSDVFRNGESTGFADMESIIVSGYDGPYYFYTSRITPDLQAEASTAGAAGITTSPSRIIEWMESHAAALDPQAPSP